ncbi:HAD family hydrolase [Actimicrobium sp. CCI2.3]|uniref:histidinol-phosphatase n=1 Tax=Actimicrobium sp. CCI2.3 TaxID=3048616 RepID=UPI002AB35695|nr:HAD family hydrolase [Actimicrobium sp. CCI2.3]MDY7573833.1 HAD family hydrolase [Actimicrobium sp. CCI2.3]MEB0022444.1 HAD family hydrolase [Actimicrobium sp. CCI2.3]
MSNLAIFDLDHTLLPLDSDYEWGQFICRIGAVNAEAFAKRNATFFAQYQDGSLDPIEYLEFAFGTLSAFPRKQLDAWHQQFMDEVIVPAIRPAALALVRQHQDAGDEILIITATNRFITAPIAQAFGVANLIAAEAEHDADGGFTGKSRGTPPFGPGKVTNLGIWLAATQRRLDDFATSYFYSDSQNDIPLLSLVTNPVATNPNALLAAHAHAQGWPTLDLFSVPAQ